MIGIHSLLSCEETYNILDSPASQATAKEFGMDGALVLVELDVIFRKKIYLIGPFQMFNMCILQVGSLKFIYLTDFGKV